MKVRLRRTLCLSALFLAALAPRIAAAHSPPPLPTPNQTAELVAAAATTPADFSDAVARGEASAKSCTLDATTGALRCEKIRLPGSCASGWQPGISTRDLVVRAEDGSMWWVREYAVTDVGIVMTDIVWRGAGGELLQSAGAIVAGETMQVQDPRWFAESEVGDGPCPAPAVPVEGPVIARASSATFDGTRWTHEGLRVGPWRVGNPRRAHVGSSGLLPPVVRANESAVQAQAAYWFAPFIALTVFADTSGRLGAGPTLISARRESLRSLDLAAVYDASEGTLRPLVVGDVSVGERRHLRGHFEHPVDEDAWALRRLEHGGLFREWRLSAVGVALGGDGHALNAQLGYVTDPEMLDPVLAGGLHFGSRFDAAFTQWNVGLEHESLVDADTVHDSTAGIDFGIPLGSPGSAYIRPGAGVVANYGTVTARRGFDASTTMSVLGMLEAGMALEGRFERARHRLAPRLRVGGEALGIQQRQLEEGAPPFAYERPDRWRYASLLLDQSIQQRGWSLAFPVGLYADAIGDEALGDGLADWQLHGSLSVRLGRASVQLRTVCRDDCSSAQAGAFARLGVRRGVTVGYGLSDLDAEAVGVLYADALLSAAQTAVTLVQPGFGAGVDDEGFSHTAGVELESGALRAALRGHWGAESDAGRGLSGQLDWHWPTLGWGLGVAGGARLDGVWGATAGLTLR